MPVIKGNRWFADENSQRVTLACFVAIAAIAFVDAVFVLPLGFGLLYLIPLCIAAAFVSRWQAIVLVAICTAFWEAFSNLPGETERFVRAGFVFVGYSFVTILVNRLAVHGRAASRRLHELDDDLSILRRSQQEVEFLFNATPVAIFTVSADGKIVQCNRAAHELFAVALGGLPGQAVNTFIPEFEQLGMKHADGWHRCDARQADGTGFAADLVTSKINRTDNDAVAVVAVKRGAGLA